MKILTLQRIYNGQDCTLGVLLDENKKVLCCTLEDAWAGNKNFISCVPDGQTYDLSYHNGPKQPDVWELKNVPDRQMVLIHAGNSANDTLGCILVGEYFRDLNGQKLLLNTSFHSALDRLRAYIGRDVNGKLLDFKLKIERI